MSTASLLVRYIWGIVRPHIVEYHAHFNNYSQYHNNDQCPQFPIKTCLQSSKLIQINLITIIHLTSNLDCIPTNKCSKNANQVPGISNRPPITTSPNQTPSLHHVTRQLSSAARKARQASSDLRSPRENNEKFIIVTLLSISLFRVCHPPSCRQSQFPRN